MIISQQSPWKLPGVGTYLWEPANLQYNAWTQYFIDLKLNHWKNSKFVFESDLLLFISW